MAPILHGNVGIVVDRLGVNFYGMRIVLLSRGWT